MNELKDNNGLHISWCDSAWTPILNQSTVLDYFSERSNPFYDRTCNNEIVKMQRLSHQQLNNMQGIEYILLHVQEPILYVIRKQHRHSPTAVTPMADYYIIAGVVYQAPDLNSLINSRILTTVHNLHSAFDESNSYCRYHPSKGYWWEFSKDSDKDNNKDKTDKTAKDKTKEEANSSTKFQRKRVDILLSELTKKFPPKLPQTPQQQQQQLTQQSQQLISDKTTNASASVVSNETEIKTEKSEANNTLNTNAPLVNTAFRPMTGPPEKKQRIN